MQLVNIFLGFLLIIGFACIIQDVRGDAIFDAAIIIAQPTLCKPNNTITSTLDQQAPLAPFVSCDSHCKVIHGTESGVCDADFNCICSGLKIVDCTPETGDTCICDDSTLPPDARFVIEAICDSDCRCIHGAKAGACNYGSKQCICDYTDFTWSYSSNHCAYARVYNGSRYILEAASSLLDPLPIVG